MVERVHTGGSKVFEYDRETHKKLSAKEKKEIKEAYRLANERKKLEEKSWKIEKETYLKERHKEELELQKERERKRELQKEREQYWREKEEKQANHKSSEGPKSRSEENNIHKAMMWLNHFDHQPYNYRRILDIFLWSIILFLISLGFFIFSLMGFNELNTILIWFIPLGWIVLIISGIFILKYAFTFIKKFPNWFKRQRRWVKLFLILILAVYLFFVYKTHDLRLGYFNSNPINIMSPHELNISERGFSLINNFRIENNLQKFDSNPGALNMALSIAKEYPNSLISEGKKANLSSKFNVGGSVAILNGELDENSGFTVDYVVSRWEGLGGWRTLLLNATYKSGAFACYSDKCLMVISTESYKESNLSKANAGQKVIDFLNSMFSNISSAFSNGNSPKESSGFGSFVQGVFDPKSQIDISQLEQEVHRLINVQRANNGLSPLAWDSALAQVARAHSQDMVNRNFFAHTNPSGEDPTARANRAGYSCYKNYGSYYTNGIAENIGLTPIYSSVVGCGSTTNLESLADCIVSGWMTSPGHRQNILTATYTQEGIGIAYSADDKAYTTQDFC